MRRATPRVVTASLSGNNGRVADMQHPLTHLHLRAVFALGFGAVGALALPAPAAAQTITEYAVPNASHPNSIAAGPDGALWFTGYNVNNGFNTSGGSRPPVSLPNSSFPRQ
jgi:streptogramin lyase